MYSKGGPNHGRQLIANYLCVLVQLINYSSNNKVEANHTIILNYFRIEE